MRFTWNFTFRTLPRASDAVVERLTVEDRPISNGTLPPLATAKRTGFLPRPDNGRTIGPDPPPSPLPDIKEETDRRPRARRPGCPRSGKGISAVPCNLGSRRKWSRMYDLGVCDMSSTAEPNPPRDTSPTTVGVPIGATTRKRDKTPTKVKDFGWCSGT